MNERRVQTCERCGRTLPVAFVSSCPMCDPRTVEEWEASRIARGYPRDNGDPRESAPMIDPTWTPAKGYDHASAILEALARADGERFGSLVPTTEGR